MPPNSGVRGYRPASTLLETPRPKYRARPSPRARPRGRVSKEIHSGDTSSSPDPLDVISDESDQNIQSSRADNQSSGLESSFSSPPTQSQKQKARTVEDRRRGLDKELERLGGREGSSKSASTLFGLDNYHSHYQEQDLVDDRDDTYEEDDWAIFKEDKPKHADQKRADPDSAPQNSPQSTYFTYASPTLPSHPFGLTPTHRFPEPVMVSPSRSHMALDGSVGTQPETMTGEGSLHGQTAAIGNEQADLIDGSMSEQEASQPPLGPAGEEEVEREQEKEEEEGQGHKEAALESDPVSAKTVDITNDIAPVNEAEAHITDETPKEGPAADVIPAIVDETIQLARDPMSGGSTIMEASLTIEQPDTTTHDSMGSAEGEAQRIQLQDQAESNETAAYEGKPVDGGEPATAVGSKMDTAQDSQVADAALVDSEMTIPDNLESSDPGASVPQPSTDTMEVDEIMPEVGNSTPALTSSPAAEEGEEELDDDDLQPLSDGILEEDNDVDMEDASATATAAVAPTPSDSGTPSIKGKPGPKKKTVAKPKSNQAGKAVTTTPAKAPKATKAKSKIDDLKPPAKKSKASRDTPDSMNGTSVSVASAEMTRQDSSDKVYCVCRKRESEDDDEVTMIECESCLDWFHAGCIGLSDDQVDIIDVYICRSCERSTKQKTVYKQQCKRDGCDKGLKGRNSKFCSDLCAYKYHKTLADSITNKKNLKQINAAFTAYPKPPPVQIIQHATFDLRPPAAPSLEHDVLSVVQSQLLTITSKLEIVRKRQEILRQAIDHAESLGPVVIAVEENRSGKSKRKGGPTEDKQCAWDPRLVLSDDEVRVMEIAGNGDGGGAGDGSGGGEVCELGKRRCDRHSGWQKTIGLSLDLEEQQLSRSHASLLEQQEAMIKSAETVKESEQARTAFRDRLSAKRRI